MYSFDVAIQLIIPVRFFPTCCLARFVDKVHGVIRLGRSLFSIFYYYYIFSCSLFFSSTLLLRVGNHTSCSAFSTTVFFSPYRGSRRLSTLVFSSQYIQTDRSINWSVNPWKISRFRVWRSKANFISDYVVWLVFLKRRYLGIFINDCEF